MAVPFASAAPTRLENLLQVPLKLIALEDLLREKSSSVSPPEVDTTRQRAPNNRLCHSADSPSSSEAAAAGRIHPDKPKSHSSPCLFSCCATPSRWRKSGPYSNLAHFTTTAVKLPDGSTVVIPVMDYSEETVSDIEMRRVSDDVDETDRIPEDSRSHSLSERMNVLSSPERSLGGYANMESQIITGARSGESTSSRSSSSSAVLGKVTENPTRYEDFLIAQGCSNGGNSSNPADRNRTVVRSEEVRNGRGTPKQLNEEDTLKLTFYNDGRKQSVKEFRMGAGGETGGDTSQDGRYSASPHGLQLSRILRGIPPQDSPPQRHGQYDDDSNDNTHRQSQSPHKARPPPPAKALNSTSNNTEKSWEQWDGLQISRCQKESREREREKTPNLDRENNNVSNSNISSDQERNNNSQTQTQDQSQEGDKGESENLIDKHLQSVLTSLRYVRTAPATASGSSRGNVEQEQSSTSTPATTVPPRESPKSQAPSMPSLSSVPSKPLIQAEVERGLGIVRVTPQVRSSPGALKPSNAPKVLTRIMPKAQPSPPTGQSQQLQQQQQHQQPPSNSNPIRPAETASASYPERTIARIPTRPYLLKNIIYEKPPQQPPPPQRQTPPSNSQQHYGHGQGQQQQQRLMMVAPGPVPASASIPSSLHSNPKRFKSAVNLPMSSPGSRPSHQQQQQQQIHGFMQSINRFPNINSGPGGNGSIDHHYNRNSMPHAPHHVSNSMSDSRRSFMPYASSNSQQYGNANANPPTLYGPGPKSPSRSGLTNIPPPYRSPIAAAESGGSQPPQKYANAHHIQESIMIAAAVAANASADPSSPDQGDYYDRLRAYYEYYQNQQVYWSQLAQYYQKVQVTRESPSTPEESLLRQWRGPSERGNNNERGEELENIARHKLALQQRLDHPHPSGGYGSMAAPASIPKISPLAPIPINPSHGRVAEVIDLTAPPAPPPLQNNPNKYNHNSQQLLHLRQMHQERQYQNQLQQHHNQQQQQQQLQSKYQDGPHHIQHHQPQSHQSYPSTIHYSQQGQQSHPPPAPQNNFHQSGMIPSNNYPIQNNAQYQSAYSRLAAAAAAAASSGRANTNPNAIDMAAHLRAGLTGNRNVPANHEEISSRYHHHPSPQIPNPNHPSVNLTVPIMRNMPAHPHSIRKATPPQPSEGVPYSAFPIHRQAFEQAIKNNFKLVAAEANANRLASSHNSGGTIVRNPRHVIAQPSSISPPHHPDPIPTSVREWSKEINTHDVGTGRMGVHNMSKEPLGTASSPTLSHQTSVIRRLQPPPVSPARNIPIVATPSPSKVLPVEIRSPQAFPQNHPYNYSSSSSTNHNIAHTNTHGHSHDAGILKRRINIIRHESRMVPSPIHLIAGEEEIVPGNVSPSTVLTTVNPVDDRPPLHAHMDGDNATTSAGNNRDADEVMNRPELNNRNAASASGSSAADSGNWQYDHVVLLDKRTRTFMCKRCFETLKTEQEIRNHLFCKMLAGHVRCHVCLQLVKTDQYPEHLQVHGVRPPEDEDDNNNAQAETK